MDAANNDQQPRPSLFSRLSNFQIRPSTYLLLLAFMFFMFVFDSTARAPKKTTLLTQLGRMSGSGSDPRTEHRLQETITRKHAQHDRYRDWLYHNASHWQPPPSKDNTTVELPPWNQTFALQQWSDDKVQVHLDALHLEQPDVPHWKNLTGFLKGQWEVMDIQLEGNETKWKEQRGDTFDWSHGKFEWNVRETERDYWSKDDESPSTFLRGTVDFYDQERTDGLDFDVLQCV